MFQQPPEPIAGSLTLSALVAALPLITIFVLLGWARVKAYWAGLAALAVAITVAVLGYGMPELAVLSASQGAIFGLLPIMAIVLAALWVYQLTVVTGRFEDLRAAFHLISDDPRIQAIVIAFCFGGLLEAESLWLLRMEQGPHCLPPPVRKLFSSLTALSADRIRTSPK